MAKYLGPSEDRIQQDCYMWFWNTYPELRGLLFSVPNGGYRRKKEGKLLKATGLVSGVSDLIFLYQGKAYLIEMKTAVGYMSSNQKEWMAKVQKQGFLYFVRRDLEGFKELINKIIEKG